MNKLIDDIKIISVIIGTIIGAGFASGKEIYIFFARYGKNGVIGALISSILTAIIIFCTIRIVKKYNIENNNQFVKKISNNERITEILKNIINIFLVASFWIMCTGFCTFFKQEFNVPIIITASINAIVVYLLLMQNINGIIRLNLIVVPIMIAIIIVISIKNYSITNIFSNNINIENNSPLQAIVSAILYTSYNSITLIPIIISLSKGIKRNGSIKIITILSGIIIFMLIIEIYKMLVLTPTNVKNIEIPILEILNECHIVKKIIYCVAIITAIFTSAISSGYGALENINNKQNYKKMAFLICALEIPISYIGFGRLVEVLYPVFGGIGIIQMLQLTACTFNCRNR